MNGNQKGNHLINKSLVKDNNRKQKKTCPYCLASNNYNNKSIKNKTKIKPILFS